MEPKTSKERTFSVELESKASLRSINVTQRMQDNVLIEGTIGDLVGAYFTEGIVLEVVGQKGVVRLDLTPEEISGNKTAEKQSGGDKR